MKKIWNLIGRVAFWVSWPALWVYLRSTKRTRVVIISGKKNILLVKGWYSAGKWNLPGGGIHAKETPVEAAVREVEEETGLALKPERLEFANQLVVKEYGLRYRCGVYIAKLPDEPELKAPKGEISDLKWLGKDELTDLGPLARQLLADWS